MSDTLLDPPATTGPPNLLQFLWDTYCAEVGITISDRIAAGKPTKALVEAKPMLTAVHFLAWATKYLDENRVVQNFPADDNHGIRLSNDVALVISPAVVEADIRGTMQDSTVVAVTEGRGRNDGDVPASSSLFRI